MAKKPKTIQLPYEQTDEALETPDIQAFRSFAPSTSMLTSALGAKFDRARANVTDSYGAYSGIPSQVARNRMRDDALRELNEDQATALNEGSERAQALRMAQLEALAGLTRKQKTSGFRTDAQQRAGGTASSLISGGASAGTAAIIIA